MNSFPANEPVKTASPAPLKAGQIPTAHDLLDWDQVDLLTDDFDAALAELEAQFADYVTNVSLKEKSRR